MNAVRYDRPDHAAEVKRRLSDPRAVCAALGLMTGAQRQRGGLLVRCPAHAENTASCSVTPGPDKTLRVRCFACAFSGDVFHLIAARLGLDAKTRFVEVLEHAAELAGVDLGNASPRRTTRALAPLPAPDEPQGPPPLDAATFTNVATTLLEHAPLAGSVAVGLAARGILFDAQRDGWGELPHNVRLTGDEADRARDADFDTEDLAADRALAALRAGFSPASLRWLVDKRGDGFSRPSHRLLIPWRRPDGVVWGLQRRYAPLYGNETTQRGTPKYLWPPEAVYAPPARYAYGVDAPELATADEVWIVEGAHDVLAMRALNRNDMRPRALAALGLPGVSTWEAFRSSVLPHVRGRVVHVSLDADRAGDEAIVGIVADVRQCGARVADRTRPPEGANDWAELTSRYFWTEETHVQRHARRARERHTT